MAFMTEGESLSLIILCAIFVLGWVIGDVIAAWRKR
jgi:hypothetical protein